MVELIVQKIADAAPIETTVSNFVRKTPPASWRDLSRSRKRAASRKLRDGGGVGRVSYSPSIL